MAPSLTGIAFELLPLALEGSREPTAAGGQGADPEQPRLWAASTLVLCPGLDPAGGRLGGSGPGEKVGYFIDTTIHVLASLPLGFSWNTTTVIACQFLTASVSARLPSHQSLGNPATPC